MSNDSLTEGRGLTCATLDCAPGFVCKKLTDDISGCVRDHENESKFTFFERKAFFYLASNSLTCSFSWNHNFQDHHGFEIRVKVAGCGPNESFKECANACQEGFCGDEVVVRLFFNTIDTYGPIGIPCETLKATLLRNVEKKRKGREIRELFGASDSPSGADKTRGDLCLR